MKLLLLTILILTTKLSYANDYTSEVVCTFSQSGKIIKSIKHDLWRDYNKEETWKFDLNFATGIYQAAFKLDYRNAYIEIKNLDTGLVSSNLSDFKISYYAPFISTTIDDISFYCKAVNDQQ